VWGVGDARGGKGRMGRNGTNRADAYRRERRERRGIGDLRFEISKRDAGCVWARGGVAKGWMGRMAQREQWLSGNGGTDLKLQI
jgi:hypothetical protein